MQRKKRVGQNDNLVTLTEWYYKTAPELIIESLNKISRGEKKFEKQNKSQRSYFSWPTKEKRKELKQRLMKK